jgi:hypothetical protein
VGTIVPEVWICGHRVHYRSPYPTGVEDGSATAHLPLAATAAEHDHDQDGRNVDGRASRLGVEGTTATRPDVGSSLGAILALG